MQPMKKKGGVKCTSFTLVALQNNQNGLGVDSAKLQATQNCLATFHFMHILKFSEEDALKFIDNKLTVTWLYYVGELFEEVEQLSLIATNFKVFHLLT